MKRDVAENFAFGQQFMPAIRAILAPYVVQIVEATVEQDTTQATDLVVISPGPIRIACRVRRAGRYEEKYKWDFTIRSRIASGEKTEIDKIRDGWAKYLIYGHQREEGATDFSRWMLIDIQRLGFILREDDYRISYGLPPVLPQNDIPNRDGRTWLRPYDIRKLPAGIVVATSHPFERAPALQPDLFGVVAA